MKFTFLLLFAAPLVCHAQLCEAPLQTRDALQANQKSPSDPADRSAAIRAVVKKYPGDLWAHRAYQDTFRQGMLYRLAVIDEYKKLLEEHTNEPKYLYLYGRTLVGTKTPEAITVLNQSLAKDPNFLLAHLALAEIYRTPLFKDPVQLQVHLQAWMSACPAQFEGFPYLERMENSSFVRDNVARLRNLVENRNDESALEQYRTLWTLEFQTHSASDFPQVKDKVRHDLMRLRVLEEANRPYLASTFREGYKITDDQDGLKWTNEKFPVSSVNPNAAMEAYQEWQKAHPYPRAKAGEKFDQNAITAHNKAFLNVTAEWIQRWPDNNFVWSQRFMALQMNRDTSDAEVERVAEGLRKTGRGAESTGFTPLFQIAALYLQRNMHLDKIPDLVKQGLEEMDKAPASPMNSDLYPPPPGMNTRSIQFMNRISAHNTMADAYLKTDQTDQAIAALAEIRKNLDANKPNDSSKDMEKRNWSSFDSSYWNKLGRIAEKQGRKLDALTFYQNEMRSSTLPGIQDVVKRKAKVLWTDLGGTDAAWNAWATRIEPAKPMVTASTPSNWEKTNKPLPAFELTDLHGKTWHLIDMQGKATLVNLWATWCEPCRAELPHLQKLYEKLKDRTDIKIITFNTDDNPSVIETFLKENKYTFPVLPAQAYVDRIVPSLSIPRNWIVDKNAVMQLESIGFGQTDEAQWMDQITEQLQMFK